MSPATVRLWGLCGQTWSAAETCAEPSAVVLWKRYTARMRPSDFESAAAITAGLLCDSRVKDKIRRFVEEEQLPWLEVS